MPRPKPQDVYAWPGVTLPDAKATVQSSIERLLATANCARLPPSANLGPMRTQVTPELANAFQTFATSCDHALEALSERRRVSFSEWPEWAAMALINVHANIRKGQSHLRRCRHCTAWMLVDSAHQEKCDRARCQRIEKRLAKRVERAARRQLDRGKIVGARRRTF